MADDGDIAPASVGQDWTGWSKWGHSDGEGFAATIFGGGYARSDAPGRALVAVLIRNLHRNINGHLHGGFLSAFADHAFFMALGAMGRADLIGSTTIDLSMQYLASGQIGAPLIADVELLRETGRMMFLRLTLSQEGTMVAASSATIRKLSPSR